MSNPAIFLDRDGVVNEAPAEGQYVTTLADMRVLSDALDALASLRVSVPTVRLVVVTNQRAVAKGLLTHAQLDALHGYLGEVMATRGAHLDGIYVCPHEVGVCECRKPGIGLIAAALRDMPDIDPRRSALVGDSLNDILAGQRAGLAACYLIGPRTRRATIVADLAEHGRGVDGQADSLADLLRWRPALGLATVPAGRSWQSVGAGAAGDSTVGGPVDHGAPRTKATQ